MINEFGKYISKLRKEKKATLQKVSDSTGYSLQYIWQIENGKCRVPSDACITELSHFYEVPYHVMKEKATNSRDCVELKINQGDREHADKFAIFLMKKWESITEEEAKKIFNYSKKTINNEK